MQGRGRGPRRQRRAHRRVRSRSRRARHFLLAARRHRPRGLHRAGARHRTGARQPGHRGERRRHHPRFNPAQDGRRAVGRGAGGEPGRRVQPHPPRARRHARTRLRPHRQHQFGQRPDRPVRPGQLRRGQGRHARLHDVACARGRAQGHHRQFDFAGLLRNGDGDGDPRRHPRGDRRPGSGRPPRQAGGDRARGGVPGRRGRRLHHRCKHPRQRRPFKLIIVPRTFRGTAGHWPATTRGS